jgi:hypothetical protein
MSRSPDLWLGRLSRVRQPARKVLKRRALAAAIVQKATPAEQNCEKSLVFQMLPVDAREDL